MGKSKFPGKPSKSVMKERIRVLHKNEIQRSANVSPRQTIKRNRKWTCSDSSIRKAILFEEEINHEIELSTEAKTNPLQDNTHIVAEGHSSGKGYFDKTCVSSREEYEKQMGSTDAANQLYAKECKESLNYSPAELEKLIKKKTVTFKNNPESSDTSKKGQIHNPLNKGPLISIMKKECTSAQRYVLRGNNIVRPSRLTDILRHSENIDKTNSLSFRTIQISNALQQRNPEDAKLLSSKKNNFVTEMVNEITSDGSESLRQNFGKLEKVLETNSFKSPNECKLRQSGEHGEGIKKNPLKKKDEAVPNKIILREPRLNFEPQNASLSEGNYGIESTSGRDSPSPHSSIRSACGVCDSLINSKAALNRKYGIVACDVCRKFISKITKKSISSSTSPLPTFKIQCNKSDGQCVISSQACNTAKSFKKLFDERCSACWLKKCINTFHFPSGHKLRLNTILSEIQKDKLESKTKSFSTKMPLICNEKISTLGCKQGSVKITEPNRQLKESHFQDQFHNSDKNVTMGIWLPPRSFQSKDLNSDRLIANRNRNSNSVTTNKQEEEFSNPELLSSNFEFLPKHPKRQKIDFKGPRVKHVCRSASIALGQRIARFSNIEERGFKLSEKNSEISLLNKPLFGDIYFSNNVKGNVSELQNHHKICGNEIQQFNGQLSKSLTEHDPNVAVNSENNYQFQKRKQKSLEIKNTFMVTRNGLDSLARRNLLRLSKGRGFEKKSKVISIEFCDSYIPAEINETGFGIILTGSLPIFALCFLCGSMDLENLHFCASCCEPYHSYCIQEDGFRDKNKYIAGGKTENILNKLNWVCHRCTVCYTCNMSSGSKIKCQKCKKNYHSTCMGTSKGLLGADRPLICRSCLKCQTCSTKKVSKYVDNQPVCTHCFKLNQSESRCPLCNNTFDDILDVIILKCGVCKKFIHAKCEGLTEVQSNLQRTLPENIPFACKKCSLESDYAKNLANKWREAVIEELMWGLLDILKLLSRSRQVNILKRDKNKYICNFAGSEKEYSGRDDKFIGENENILNGLSSYINESSTLNGSRPLSLYDIRKRVIDKHYVTLCDFNADMNTVILPLKNDELILTYKEILSEKFAWFQNETKTCTDALEDDMFDSSNIQYPMDDVVTEDVNAILKLPEAVTQIVYSLNEKNDNRACILCKNRGDGNYFQESRLLYCGFNTWVHANCILWSNGVYEEFDGTIQNVSHVLKCGRLRRCAHCHLLGATIGCSANKCFNFFHFACAIEATCVFTSDKLIHCTNHSPHYTETNTKNARKKFDVCRPLYVDFDPVSVQKTVEPCKVKFMVGSLAVVQLGNVCPKFSDTPEAIVPINFICTRLYWSSKEPWKIVKYNVQTSIQHMSSSIDNDVEKNFTVDHSQNSNLVEKQLSDIACWQNALIREKNLDSTLHHDFRQFGNLPFSEDDYLNDTNSDEFVEEEPQNNSDLLPPEIKDAIFEDLPHDILDGISMLDIFPKLMIYEDMLPADAKTGSSFVTDICDSSGLQSSAAIKAYSMLGKHEANAAVRLEENTTINTQNTYHKAQPHCRNKQRSPAVTLISKFENPRGYLTTKTTEKGLNDIKSCNSRQRKHDNIRENLEKQKLKFIQLDGTDDTFLDHLSSQKKTFNCHRCQCTYRTIDSFQRHLLICTQVSATQNEVQPLSKFHFNVNSLDDILKNNVANKNNISGNQGITNLTVIAKSSLMSTPTVSQDDIISSNYYGSFLIDPNISNELKSFTIENINEYCDESRWNNDGNESGNLIKNKRKHSSAQNIEKVNTERFEDNSISKSESAVNLESSYVHTNKTEFISPVKYNHLQFVNQPLLLNSQFSQKEEQTQQQQLLVLQQSNSQPLFIQQMSNTQTIPQNIFPVLQYTAMQASPNSLMQGSVFPSEASGNLIISSGLQMLTMPSIQLSAQSSPQLIGGFNQTPSLHLSQNQMIIGGSTALDILPNSNQIFLATSPMYYGLETIVQNTVMSSQQFVSTAMQGVLSQNASFSATTTQVFQSSKFEPVNETQSNYVVLNNADGSTIMVPQTNVLAGFMNTSTDFQSTYSNDFGNVCTTSHQALAQEPNSNNILPLISTLSDMSSVVNNNPISQINSSLNVENNSHITPSRNEFTSAINDSLTKSNTNSVKNNTVVKHVNSNPKLNQKIIRKERNKFNQTNCLPDSTYLLNNSTQSMQCKDKCMQYCCDKKGFDDKSGCNNISLSNSSSNKSVHDFKNYLQQENNNNEHITDALRIPHDEKYDKKKKQIENKPLSQLYSTTSSKLPHTSLSFGSISSNVPTKKVSPILHTQPNINTPVRPTNRVLPMQSISKTSRDMIKPSSVLKNIVNKLIDNSSENCSKKICEDLNDNNQQKLEISTFVNEHITKELSTPSDIHKDDIQEHEHTSLCKNNIEDETNKNNVHKFKENNDVSEKGKTFAHMDYHSPNYKFSVTDEIDNSGSKYLSSSDISHHLWESAKSEGDTKTKNRQIGKEPQLIYEIQSEDGFSYKSQSIADVWETVFEAVQCARRVYGLSSLPLEPFAEMCGTQMIGLKTNALKYLVEQLPGTERCTKYIPKYHKYNPANVIKETFQQDQEKLFENLHGAIRCEPFIKKSQYDIFSWLASKHRKQPKQIFVQPLETELIARRCNTSLPMAMKYRTLKETCKQSVGVFRSLIHGRGLFCIKDIEAGEMVIEYSGELIRSTLTDKRERFYDSKGIGCYMFKIDENFVVDATMRGNAARFINHSCEPNCYSRVVDILGHKHIIIFSLRRIVQGEELTYDYKFPFEDVKIPCSCGSRKCRRYLN